MRLPCPAQLYSMQSQSRILTSTFPVFGRRILLTRPRAKNNPQKHEGVYFEYEAVDPDAAEELTALQGKDEEQFSWAKRSRDSKKTYQDRVRDIVPDNPRRPQKGGNRGRRPNAPPGGAARDRQHATGQAAAAAASDGPVLPSYSPVQTPAMRARASTPEELLIRPNADRRVALGPSQQFTGPGLTNARDLSSQSGVAASSSSSPTSSSIASTPPDAAVSAPSASTDRRKRLLQRMRGGVQTSPTATSVPATTEKTQTRSQDANGVTLHTVEARAAKISPPQAAALQDTGEIGTGPAVVAAVVDGATAGASAATVVEATSGTALNAVSVDLRSQLADLAAQLPSEETLPPDAHSARALLASILSPSTHDLQEIASSDVSDMLQQDLTAQQEFAEWMRRGSTTGEPGGDGIEGADELTEAEAADLMAALQSLGMEGDLADMDLDFGIGEDNAGEDAGDDSDGNDTVRAAAQQVLELREVMAQLDMNDGAGQKDQSTGADMTDEQVIEMLKASDPALYELLKDVPDFDKLNLDMDLDLGSVAEKLTAEELAELEAEGAGAGEDGAGGQGEEEELEALMQEMRGMGLMQDEGADWEGDEEGDDVGDLSLGDLLEEINEDEDLDTRARMRAQFALQSMFNQPADELTSKGTRGGSNSIPRSTPRGTTGMARGAAVDDEDGGAAPPPALPKPAPKSRK